MWQKIWTKLAGDYNAKQLKKLTPRLEAIKKAEAELIDFSAEKLQQQFADWKKTLTDAPEQIEDLLPAVFAGIRCASRLLQGTKYQLNEHFVTWDMVPYDVQLLGGMVLHEGKISEMKTGEGKTLVCTLPVILNALTSKGVHVVTVNDYLAQRDAQWMSPLYEFCGLSVGVITAEISAENRQKAYQADITYGTNNEFGFDYLRDNMSQNTERLAQRELHFAIVDEVDSILIDEARTPLIISAPAQESVDKYGVYSQIVPQLSAEQHYTIDHKQKQVTLTEEGIKFIEGQLGTGNIFTEAGFSEVHHLEQALKAQVIMKRDQDYVVREGRVVIVDEFTGRLMTGRRYSDGLHQALEAKEKLEIQRESKTLATITFQNYFRLYEKLAGMTGTAETEAEEFAQVYRLDTVVIPTHKPLRRDDRIDKIFKSTVGKLTAIGDLVESLYQKGQPVLIGTVHIEKSEQLSQLLESRGIPHEVLNAKHHAREAEIISKAGQRQAVTIATNMAGRGTDIKLGAEVAELGGLFILGTERHESRRIDNQLRGRSGRQGDPGVSQFFVSMEDELMRRFGGEKMARLMERLGMPENEAIENPLFSRAVENAQKRIEGFYFDMRKHIVQYDDVMNIHRGKIYARRKEILLEKEIESLVPQLISSWVKHLVEREIPTEEKEEHWDSQDLTAQLKKMIGSEFSAEKSLESARGRSEVIKMIESWALEQWDARRSSFPAEWRQELFRSVMLHTYDELWLEHIDQMTHLRDRVSLAGYAQKDPVMEYKREAYEMFCELLFQVYQQTIRRLFWVEVKAPPTKLTSALPENAQTNQQQIDETIGSAVPLAPNGAAAAPVSRVLPTAVELAPESRAARRRAKRK